MAFIQIAAGVLCIALAAMCFFAQEWIWSLDQFFHDFRGIKAERTDTWAIRQYVLGVCLLALGSIYLYKGVMSYLHPPATLHDIFESIINATPTPLNR